MQQYFFWLNLCITANKELCCLEEKKVKNPKIIRNSNVLFFVHSLNSLHCNHFFININNIQCMLGFPNCGSANPAREFISLKTPSIINNNKMIVNFKMSIQQKLHRAFCVRRMMARRNLLKYHFNNLAYLNVSNCYVIFTFLMDLIEFRHLIFWSKASSVKGC